MKQTIYGVDDEPAALRTLKNYVSRIPDLISLGYEQNPVAAIDFLSSMKVLPDILVLDISMSPRDGFYIARMFVGKMKIIFTTAHEEYALTSYEVRAVDYLLKAFTFERFSEAIQKCRELSLDRITESSRRQSTVFKDSDSSTLIKVEKSNILYLESSGNYTKIHLDGGSHFMPHMSLKAVIEQLDDTRFIRVQKSFAINLWKVKNYRLDQVELTNGSLINIGRRYKTKVRESIDKLHNGI